MAIFITQYAGSPNMANSNLLWEVTSSQYTQPQFQYTNTLKSGCGTTLTTVKQQPNPSGKGVFNLGRLVKQYLDYDADPLLFAGGADGFAQVNRETAKFFIVANGEEYGTTTTSSVTQFSASYTGSVSEYYFINGVLDPNYGSFNWSYSPRFYNPYATPTGDTFNYNVCLTDAPRTQYARSTDYLTISAINGNFTASQDTAQDLYAVLIDVYYTGSSAYSEQYININNGNNETKGGPRTTTSQLWSNVNGLSKCTSSLSANTQTSGSLLMHMPIGPQNITNYGNFDFATSNWDYYTVKIVTQQGADDPNTQGVWDEFTIYKTEGACDYNGVRFGFINNYRVWDWYTFALATSKDYSFDRGIYQQTFVDYSTTSNTVAYDIARRGNNAYYTNIDENFTANSDWLTQEEADWLEQLFYSPNVYIQDGTNMLPIVVTTANLITKTNPRSQKNFQYTITYQLANSKRAR